MVKRKMRRMDRRRMQVVLIVDHMVEIDSFVVGIGATWLIV
jgi:hypothetical protein